ncbi:hypothetical protein [Opitutus sp. ER46]|uniref:hypothetical protein n=1 Tax=Opitutus sp. ER46 TaxID=2161864 RepID=UPI0018EE5256|nr:hypothetical protein [Opitutus sp. ER46]
MLRHHASSGRHNWKFFRTGGLDQVALETTEDLLALPTLDQKLWVALSCPTKGLQLDERTLTLIDTDRDGHIRVPEVLQAVAWASARLKRPADLLKGEPALPLSAMQDASPEDQLLVASAREIAKRLGKSAADALAPDDFKDPDKIFPHTALNGDGVLSASESEDPEVQSLIKDIVACLGGARDRNGSEGVSPEKVQAFYDETNAYLGWLARSADQEIAVLGDRTAAACAALAAVRAKVEDYFARCRLAAFDGRAVAALNRQESEFLALAAKDLKLSSEEIAGFPLARVSAEGVLPLLDGCNPAWATALARVQRDAVAPVFGAEKRTLTAEEWSRLNTQLAPYETWNQKKAGAAVERLGVDRLRAILASDVRAKLDQLFATDRQLRPQFEAIAAIERLVRYHRDLRPLLHNFVNFADFYSQDRWAVFQAGKLYLDARTCELCIRVDDPGAHAALATMSKSYIAYVDCRRGADTMRIAACFTQGDSDYLFVGRNGVFYDRADRDWEATITKIIDSPISLGQAFWSPYKKVIRFIEEQVAKRAAAADTAAVSNLSTGSLPPGAPKSPPPAAPAVAAAAPARKLDLSAIIGLSVALGSIGTFLAAIFSRFVDLPWWHVPFVILAIMLVISTPAVLIAWMKLRQRNLGPILEANGWAINGRVKINVPFGSALTERAKLPPNARRVLKDPYEDKEAARRRRLIIVAVILLALAALAWSLRGKGYWTQLKSFIDSPATPTQNTVR